MKAMIQVLVILLLCQPLSAQSGKGLLRDVKQQYQEAAAWRITFEHVFIWTMAGDTLVSNGQLLTGPDGAFRVDLEQAHLLSDGKALWRWEDGGMQVLLEDLGASEDVILPHQFFVSLEDRFTPGDLNKLDRSNLELALSPKGDSEFMQEIMVHMTKERGDWWPSTLSFRDLGENLHVYRVLSRDQLKPGDPLVGTALQFTLPEGLELIDLRQPEESR